MSKLTLKLNLRTDEMHDGTVIENENDAFKIAIRLFRQKYEEQNPGGDCYAPAAKLISKTKVAHRFGENPFWVYEFECFEF